MPLNSVSTDNDVLAISWSFPVPVESVWAGFKDPEVLSRWLGRPLEWDITVGGTLVVDHGEGCTSRSIVTEADSQRGLSMTWEFPDEPDSRITVMFGSEGAGTGMDLAHYDLGDLMNSYAPGWMTHLTYLEAAVSGAPLPSSQFWPLHSTFETLYGGAAEEPAVPAVSPAAHAL
ncbi:SRPBCC domain-containing protein [Arthrobacter sp. G119Y2]|uniref:SRPBCC domain-containing protein n=1 Tax=Arthrobacter sp. G119Y2 TaxID=3134965 RepID=UPI00311A16A0